MSPSEINFDSFSGGNTSPMAGSDTAEKLADSKDKGLRPLLAYFESEISDFIIADFSSDFVFRWTGLDEEDKKDRSERAKLILTVNEMRAQDGYDKMDGPLGDAPLNPSLIGPWMQTQQQEQGPDVGEANAPPPNGKKDDENNEAADSDVPKGASASDSGGRDGGGQGRKGPAQGAEDDEEGEGKGKPFGKSLGGDAEPLLKSAVLGVGEGDEVFYAHPKHGLTSGKVLAHGKDGFTVAHEDGNIGVLWDGYHGHKTRKERKYIALEQGEDGMIAEDADTGRRIYLHGEMPDEEEK